MPNITDKIGRYDLIEKIDSVIRNMRQDSSCCIALNGNWGSGKSFVMKMIDEKYSKTEEYIVIKYDAWTNSFYSDPLIAILSCIVDTLNENLVFLSSSKNIRKHMLHKLHKTLAKLCKKSGKIAFLASIVNSIISIVPQLKSVNQISNTCLEDFKTYQQLINEVKTHLSHLTKNDANNYHKIIVLVDEIDRCLPNEQLITLERLHNLFDIRNCVVICAINNQCIAQSIKTTYGTDGYEYLRKFFNFSFFLPMSSDVFLSELLRELSEKIKEKNKIIDWSYEPTQEACNWLTFGRKIEEIDNRELERYKETIEKICSDFGWDKLNAWHTFFIIVGLYIRKFCSSTFLTDAEIQEHIERPQNSNTHEMPYFDYLLHYLDIDRENLPTGLISSRYTFEFSWHFNEIVHCSAKEQSSTPYARGVSMGKKIDHETCKKLKELIVSYAGDQTMNENFLITNT